MWVLPEWHHHDGQGVSRSEPEGDRSGTRALTRRECVPWRRAHQNSQSAQRVPAGDGRMKAFSFSRRDFLASAGFLIVTIRHIGENAGAQLQTAIAGDSAPRSDLAIDEIDSYLAIGGDGSITVSTGRIDMGTGN